MLGVGCRVLGVGCAGCGLLVIGRRPPAAGGRGAGSGRVAAARALRRQQYAVVFVVRTEVFVAFLWTPPLYLQDSSSLPLFEYRRAVSPVLFQM